MASIRCFGGVAGVAAGLVFGGAAMGQVVTVTSQDRFVEATTNNTADDGTTSVNGPVRFDANPGDFTEWNTNLNVPGNIAAQANQDGLFDGVGTFSLTSFGVTLGGGGGPGTSGTSTLTNRFAFTFQVNQNATYTLNGLIGSQLPIVTSFQLTGPGVAINDDSSAGDVTYTNVTGTMAPGTYTMKVEATGSVSYVGPGGNGAGGGTTPFTLVIAPSGSSCAADFNNSGDLTVQDIFDFLSAWFAGDPRADFNGQNGITVQDIFDFLSAWFAGCP